ncbi:hypothetical protein F4820DRAFT_204096 [Hypoxylon rubiginosum]|uniref:Uncharacterized protein n=1 Tax=Hypoxylon rubiginosum TaxID=110542 RepID=A0ACB9Z7I6_9PEZI|nr:hypothetical protein F4820DRAFT_204096 [Hypoxylon rubiginosum]
MAAFPAGSDFTYWWPRDVGAMRAWQAGRVRGWLADPRTRPFKVVDETPGAGGRMVAFAKWDPPRSFKGLDAGFVAYDEDGKVVEHPPEGEGEEGGEVQPEVKAGQGLGAPEGANVEMYEDLFTTMERMREKWRVDDKLLLHIIAADPAYHGRGIGAALIRCVLDVADAEGIPTYLEALPLAVPLYRRLGFVDVDRAVFDLAKAGMEGATAVLTIMVREPGAGTAL